MVSARPAATTPRVTTGTAVYKLLQIGPTRSASAGGDFTQIKNSSRTSTYRPPQPVLLPNATTGAVTSLSVTFDRPAVWAMATDGTSLYVGGKFRTVNGIARRGLVKLNPIPAGWTRLQRRTNGGVDGARRSSAG